MTLPDTDLLFPLAPREISPAQGAETVPLLIFRLGASLYGVPALAVREIHGLPMLAPLAQAAPWIVGLLNLRGAFVPVMDLGARLGIEAPFSPERRPRGFAPRGR